ncbi:MAG: hypothetical protein KDI18_15495 [Gammaproteobacteria bacterium]|nr:hypothetical protein [Gammaproteobacteria bacterium]
MRPYRLEKATAQLSWGIDMDIRFRRSALLTLFLFLFSGRLLALPVDLATFDLVDATVTVFGPDNASAQILEDPTFAPVGLWETALAIPVGATTLSFSYELQVMAGNEDYFDFYFGNLSSPSAGFGGFAGIYSATITRDLTGFAGGTLPLAFALNFGFGDTGFDSLLTISNVSIAQAQVPAPSALLMLTLGLLMMLDVVRVNERV